MAEADMAAFGSAIGVAIALAVVTFALRGKGHPEEPGAVSYTHLRAHET